MACAYNPENNANRLFFVSVLLGGMIFGVVLNSNIAKLLTQPVFNLQVASIKEILEKDYDLVGSQSTFELLQNNTVNIQKILNTCKIIKKSKIK